MPPHRPRLARHRGAAARSSGQRSPFVSKGPGSIDGGIAGGAAAVAGAAALVAGAWFKLKLVTRAGFNQGFALARLPVRGVRRGAEPAPRGAPWCDRWARLPASRPGTASFRSRLRSSIGPGPAVEIHFRKLEEQSP